MQTESWIAYCGYLVWLSAGLGDFICHRATDLPHTSGVAESFTHVLQLALLGVAIVIGLAFQVSAPMLLVVGALVVGHAIVGYWDTRIAFRRKRVLLPIEQHIHSVLDMAPLIAFGWLLSDAWTTVGATWPIELRNPAVPIQIWIAVLVPATVMCVIPATMEFVAAVKARADSPR